jgi:D-xylose transport system substrate-binding protein
MTIFMPYADEAETAARMAVAAALGQPFSGATVVQVNGSGDRVPSVLLPVLAVTRETVAETIVKGRVYTAAQICVDATAAACKLAGLQP